MVRNVDNADFSQLYQAASEFPSLSILLFFKINF